MAPRRGAARCWQDTVRLGADALITVIADARYYSKASPFPLMALTDQSPLRFVKSCAKGPVTAWRIEKLQEINYDVGYLPGSDNVCADYMSRPPMLGSMRMARIGLEGAVRILLGTLPAKWEMEGKLWVWSGKDTPMLGWQVQSWRTSRNALVQRTTKDTFNDHSWTFGIVVPKAERATEVARKALVDGRPVCILMPTDLVHYTAQEQDGTFDPALTMAINKAVKLSLMRPGLT